MQTIKRDEIIQDFKKFLSVNRDELLQRAVNIEELPADDDWIQDNDWDEIYKQEVESTVKGYSYINCMKILLQNL